MLLLTLLNVCAETMICPNCLENARIEDSANEWEKHAKQSGEYARQIRANSEWRKRKHPRHVQKAIAKAGNTTNVTVPVTNTNTSNSSSNINNNNNNSNVVTISNTTPAPIVTIPVAAPVLPVVAPAVTAAPAVNPAPTPVSTPATVKA